MNPGSAEAVKQGCTCPVGDNGRGEGFMLDGERCWWMEEACPLHGKEWTAEALRAEVASLRGKG